MGEGARRTASLVTTGLVLAATALTGGPAAAAEVPPDVEQVPAVELASGATDAVSVALTDGFVHVGVAFHAPPWSSIWSRALLASDDGWLLGNPELVGSSPYADVVASSDAIAWEDGDTADLMVRRDDRTVLRDEAGTYFPMSFSGTWHTSYGAMLTPVPYVDGSEVHLDDLTGDARVSPPWTPTEGDVVETYRGWVSPSAVAWDEQWLQAFGTDGFEGDGTALYASAMGPDGPTGDVVALDALWSTEPGAAVDSLLDVEVSDAWVAWLVRTETGDVVRAVPTADLAAEPLEHPVGIHAAQLAVDGDRVAVLGYVVDSDWGVVEIASLTGGEPVRTVEAGYDAVGEVDLRGDLLAVAGSHMSAGTGGARLLDLSGEGLQEVPAFPDVTDVNPLLPHVDWLVVEGITEGYDDGTFRPYAPVSRQAMAAFLYRAAGSPAWEAPTESPFADVGPASPFYAEITWLAAQGITTGYDGPGDSVLFRPTAPVSRQAMAAFLYRAADAEHVAGGGLPFTDVGGSPFLTEISWLAEVGISTGTEVAPGTFAFRPLEPVSRQAMAAFLHRMDDVVRPD